MSSPGRPKLSTSYPGPSESSIRFENRSRASMPWPHVNESPTMAIR